MYCKIIIMEWIYLQVCIYMLLTRFCSIYTWMAWIAVSPRNFNHVQHFQLFYNSLQRVVLFFLYFLLFLKRGYLCGGDGGWYYVVGFIPLVHLLRICAVGWWMYGGKEENLTNVIMMQENQIINFCYVFGCDSVKHCMCLVKRK